MIPWPKPKPKPSPPRFVALGDSIVSDCYPGPGLGAASLLFQNDPRFPEFDLLDLSSRYPEIQRLGETRSGFRLPDLEKALQACPGGEAARVLVCVGGNDLLYDFEAVNPDWFEAFARRYGAFQQSLQRKFPGAPILACNVYDPTDGTGQVASARERGQPARPGLVSALHTLNATIAANRTGATLVDLHSHFLGHGVLAAENGRVCWFQRDIEPTATGASEVRRLLWQKAFP